MHLNESELRAFVDGETDSGRARAHLGSCRVCARKADELAARAARVNRALDALAPAPAETLVAVSGARLRLQSYGERRKEHSMQKRFFGRRYRSALVGLTIAAALAIALALPSVRALATEFLGLFRVQQIAVVEINPANVPDFDRRATEIENLLSESMQIESDGEPEEVADSAQAAALAGMPVRLPVAVQPELERLTYQPGSRVSFVIDLPATRLILEELGRGDIVLPDGVDNAQVTVEMPNSVTAAYGRCAYGDTDESEIRASAAAGPTEACTVLVQMPSPTISAPSDLPVSDLGEAWLQLMGLSVDEAAQFSGTVDWTTTLVVPIPSRGANTEEVVVDGVAGTLLSRPRANYSEYMLLWIKDDVLYILTGYGDAATALSIGNSLE
ncbi:MAG: hypothetical protein ACE5FI_05425 [Anaerolineales bacterium]